MGKVIQFRGRSDLTQRSEETLLKQTADMIDGIIHQAHPDLSPEEIAGVLAHRLGALIRIVEAKERVWSICKNIAQKQSGLH